MTQTNEMASGWQSRKLWLIGLAALLLYALGFNYYVPPMNGDDVIYYRGALSIAEGDGFKLQGLWIEDWPPVQSALIAMTMKLLNNDAYYVAKFVNLLAVVLSVLLAHRLMQIEERKYPDLAALLIVIFPTSFLVGTAGQADFTFFALSMLFFLLLHRLNQSRSWLDVVACGIVLGIASLTRWQGVLMGAGILWQCSEVWRNKKKHSILPEFLSALIGASIFLGWKYWLHLCELAGKTAEGNYDRIGNELWLQPGPLELGGEILNLFTQLENVIYRIYPTGNWLVALAAASFLVILVYGFVLRVRRSGLQATDAYLLVTMSLYTVFAYKEARYFIPLAPFLLDYFFRVVGKLCQNARTLRIASAIWIAGLLAIDGVLIFYGDGSTMGPRTQLLLSSEREYIRGHYVELYDVCQELKQNYPDAILASDKFHTSIVRHYSGLETNYPDFFPDKNYDFFVQVNDFEFLPGVSSVMPAELDLPTTLEGRLSNPQTKGQVTVWEVSSN